MSKHKSNSFMILSQNFAFEHNKYNHNDDQIQKYVIGSGSFGKVSKVQFAGQKYALKQIQTYGKSQMELCQRQARTLQNSFYHPNIIKHVSSFKKNMIFFIVMEFVQGPTLERKILDFYENQRQLSRQLSQQPQNEKKCQFQLQLSLQLQQRKCHLSVKYYQIVLALHHLKKLNILHRDLKPSNILINSQNNLIKIVDFGVSKMHHTEQSLSQSQAGTPMFMAPQMVLQKKYGQKVDMWSLGVIIYQMCHQYEFPFKCKDKNQLKKKLTQMKLKIQDKVHTNFKVLILGCLQKDPSKRFSTEDILNLDFVKSYMETHTSVIKGQEQK